MGGSLDERKPAYGLASPLQHLDKDDPPCWFIAGQQDDASTHAVAFRQRLDELGIPSGLTVIQDAPHGFVSRQGWFDQMVRQADQFFKKSFEAQD